MRIVPLIFILIISILSVAHSFDDHEVMRHQLVELQRQGIAAGDHVQISDRDLAEAYLVYGNKALAQGDYDTAITHYRAGLSLLPEDGRYQMMLGVSYFRLSDYAQAEIQLFEARRLMPDAVEPKQLLVKVYYQSGQLDQAERLLSEMVEQGDGSQEELDKIRRELAIEMKMEHDINSIFSVKFDGQFHSDIATLTIETLQNAYAEQGSLLNDYPQGGIEVLLYTRDDYDLATGSPPWSAGRFDGKIRIPISSRGLSPLRLRAILHHEYNHFLAMQLSHDRAPAWLYEGLAMVAESRIHQRSIDHLALAAGSGRLIPFEKLDKSFMTLSPEDVPLAYEQSYSFVNYLLDQFGWHTLKDLLLAFGRESSVEKAFASVFNDFGLGYMQLQHEWRAGLQ